MFRLLYFSFLFLFIACQDQTKPAKKVATYKKLSGITMGVIPYKITYKDAQNRDLQATIDSLLTALNLGSSTYEKTSTITRFNESVAGINIENSDYDQHFLNNLQIAKEIFEKTNGFFDPTVAPLVNYYGFGNKGKTGVSLIDTATVLEIMTGVGFDKINIKKMDEQFRINKINPNTQLDFSAIAKGYAIDEVSLFLKNKGIDNHLIDIGGEIRAAGKSPRGDWWRIAIQDPNAAQGHRVGVTTLKNLSMATSGNYENYRIIEGKKMGHTMNPKTGFPELNNLLSATVFSEDCSVADSYATAFMAMGMEKAFNLAQKLPEIEAYLLYFDQNGETIAKYTSGLKGIINN